MLFEDTLQTWQRNLTLDNLPLSTRTASNLPEKVDITGSCAAGETDQEDISGVNIPSK